MKYTDSFYVAALCIEKLLYAAEEARGSTLLDLAPYEDGSTAEVGGEETEEDDTAVMLEPLDDLGTDCESSGEPIGRKVSAS